MAAFGLQLPKNLTNGPDGGLLTTDNEELCLRVEMLGRSGERVNPGERRDYNAYGLGWMYRCDELLAEIACSRLKTPRQA